MNSNPIPLVDLRAQYESLRAEIDAAIQSVIDDTAFIGGQRVKDFAEAFAEAIGVKHCIPVANGTDALYVALKMMGIGHGDEVITVANSWISTSETITQAGARPVFVDIDEYFHIDASRIEAAVTERTKAIVPVHLYGQPADMEAIKAVSQKYGLLLLEDCAQAHLATFKGQTVGTLGNAATFSFFPGKNLGAYGDAGAIVTDDSDLAVNCMIYANHGALQKHEHVMEGINSRLDGIQAAVLSAKLPYLRQWTEARQRLADAYDRRLEGLDELVLPKRRAETTHAFHLYVVRAQNRNELAEHLRSKGIACAIHYPTPLPMLPAYARYGCSEDDFANAVLASKEILSLPIYPELTVADVDRIGTEIERFYI